MNNIYFSYRRSASRSYGRTLRPDPKTTRREPSGFDQRVSIRRGENAGLVILVLIVLVVGMMYLPQILALLRGGEEKINTLGEAIGHE